MEIEKFLASVAPDRYDFSNDGASAEYCKIDGFQDTYDKFFIYMYKTAQPLAKYEEGKAGVMACGAKYREECQKKFGTIPDPDSGSDLLQVIYKALWCGEASLKYCMKNNRIQGDTMNSANTTLNQLYEYDPEKEKCIETLEQSNQRAAIKPVKSRTQKVSIAYIFSRYVEQKAEQEDKYNKIEGLKAFLSGYHTLGNFIPVPAGCNAPRGLGKLKDYWDLTLKIIYEHYVCGEDKIQDIVGESKSGLYKQWLDSFQDGATAKGSWRCFVEKNYLQDFVDQNADGSYGLPKELWKGHFSGAVLPDSIEQIEQFCVNASRFIAARSTRMLIRLREIFPEGIA